MSKKRASGLVLLKFSMYQCLASYKQRVVDFRFSSSQAFFFSPLSIFSFFLLFIEPLKFRQIWPPLKSGHKSKVCVRCSVWSSCNFFSAKIVRRERRRRLNRSTFTFSTSQILYILPGTWIMTTVTNGKYIFQQKTLSHFLQQISISVRYNHTIHSISLNNATAVRNFWDCFGPPIFFSDDLTVNKTFKGEESRGSADPQHKETLRRRK